MWGGTVTGLHLLFNEKNPGVGHVHVDYRGLGKGHLKPYNTDVRAIGPERSRIWPFLGKPISNYDRHVKWYGPIPGWIP